MNSHLLSLRSRELSEEQFAVAWNSGHTILEPLAKYMFMRMKNTELVKSSDFDCPNHYAKLAYEAGQRKVYADLLAMMPDTVNKNYTI